MKVKDLVINILKALLFAGIGGLILYFLYQSQSSEYQLYCADNQIAEEDCSLIKKILNDFQSANYFWILAIIVCYVISNLSRAARWLMLIRPLGYEARFVNAFFTIMLGYFANLGFPRIGEVVRAASMSRYEGIPTEKLVGTIVVDRTFDFLMLFLAISLAFLLEFDTLWTYLSTNFDLSEKLNALTSSWLIWIILAIGILGISLIYLFRQKLSESALYQKVVVILGGFVEGIKSVRGMKNPLLFVLYSFIIWFMYFLMTYLAFFSFAPTADLSPVAGLMTFIFGAFGIILPSPGGMGAYQFFVKECLEIYGINGNDAFSFANIIFFSLQIGANVLLGLVALIALPMLNRKNKPQKNA